MGAPAPSLQSVSPRVATNAAIVLCGNFVPTDHVFRATIDGSAIELAAVEVWGAFDPANPGGERHFLLRAANGWWPHAAHVVVEVHRLPPGVPRSAALIRGVGSALPLGGSSSTVIAGCTLAHRFEVETLEGPSTSPPRVGRFDAAFERTQPMPSHGPQLRLRIPHAAMESETSAVLWLEIALQTDRNEFDRWLGGTVLANRPGVLTLGALGGGLLPAIAVAKLLDTAGATTIAYPPR
jgi:hypothetical protein